MKGLCGCVGNVGSLVDVWVWWAVHWMHGCHGLLISLGSWSWQVIGVGCMAAPTPFLSRGSDVFWHLLWVKNSHRRSKQSCKQMLGVLEGGAVTPVSVSGGSLPGHFSLVPGRDAVPHMVCLQHRRENGGGEEGARLRP